MSPQPDAHVDLYNRLPLIHEAYAILRRELKADPTVSNDDLVLPILQDTEVRSLFHGETGENLFCIWIVHRHALLETGEGMVATGDTSKPLLRNPTHVAERWDPNGAEIEFMQISEQAATPTPPLPNSLSTAFRELLLTKFGISSLGLCRKLPELPPGFMYSETADSNARTQITKVVPRDQDFGDQTYPSSWLLVGPKGKPEMNCICRHPYKQAQASSVEPEVVQSAVPLE